MNVSDIRNKQSWWVKEEKHKKGTIRKAKNHGSRNKINLTDSPMKRGVEAWVLVTALPLLGTRTFNKYIHFTGPSVSWEKFSRRFRFSSWEGGRERSFGEMILYSWNPSLWHHYYLLWSISGPNSAVTSCGGEMHFEKTIMKNPEKVKLT